MHPDFTHCRLLKKDILIEMKPKMAVNKGIIHVKESIEESSIQFFTVLLVSPDVTLVKAGDTIAMSWKRITSPFMAEFKGRTVKVGITSEEEVDVVVEED